jgi:glycosyltransferase involved in cell wall biosynthesis
MPERTRVLHLVKGLGPGGAERLLVELLAVADRTTCEHRVAYALPHKAHLVPQLAAHGVDVACLGPRWPLRLRARLAEADVSHAHSPLLAAAARVVARTLPARSRPATIATEHNNWRAYKALTRLANALTYPLDARHLAVSGDARRSVWRPFRRRTEVLVHGIDVAATAAHGRTRDTTRRALGLGAGDIAVVTVANFRPQKDHATLLRAAARLRHHPHIRFFVVGQGPLADDVARLRRDLGLAPTLTLLGYRPDALDVLAAADLFALSSAHEGLPVALMEALALGVPVVATAAGGIPEAVTHGVEGLLVQPSDDAALAAAVAALATDEARRRTMGDAARARGRDFDVRRAARRLDALYAEVARR